MLATKESKILIQIKIWSKKLKQKSKKFYITKKKLDKTILELEFKDIDGKSENDKY